MPEHTSPSPAERRRERGTSLLLSGVAGYVDTAGYLSLFGLFTAHVTGNFVTVGAAVARRAPEGTIAKLAVIPVFMVAVAATSLLARALRRRHVDPLGPLLALMTLALGLFWALGVLLTPQAIAPDAWAVVAIGGAGVMALGIQNALMREAFITMSPTTVMTGNLTQVTMDLVHVALPPNESDPEIATNSHEAGRMRLAKFGLPLLGFVAGAAAGAWLTGAYGLRSLAAPTLIVGALALWTLLTPRGAVAS
jgi:uncharacterized membrane protein YoaK (UPF0700 family)